MGVELIIGAVAAAASVVTGVMSLGSAKAAARQRKEANNIANAQAKNDQAAATRRAVREARVRRAQIVQQSENSGATDSSGALGAVGVVGTNLGSNIASSSGKTLAIQGINARNQAAADYDFQSQAYSSIGSIFSTALGSFQTKQRKSPTYDFGDDA